MKKEFSLTFPEVVEHLKKNPKDMIQGEDYQEGCICFIDPIFNFFSLAIYYRNENGEIKKNKDHNFLMSISIFYQKYRVIKEINDIF